jgi:hypothetical protein
MSCVLCHDPEAIPDLDSPLCKLHSDEFVEQIQEMQAYELPKTDEFVEQIQEMQAYELPKTTTKKCHDCKKILGKEV